VHLECTNGCNNDYRIGVKTCHTAFDVKELLSTEVCTKACLGDGVVAKLHCHFGGDDRVTAVCDVCKRSTVHKRGSSLKRLHKVRLECILEKRRHSANRAKIARRYGFFVIRVCNNDARETLLEVGNRIGKTENCHDLGCNSDVITVLTRHTVDTSAKTVGYKAKLAVVHIHATLPGDAARVDIQSVSLIDVIVEHCRQKVVCRTDSVEVTCEVQVDILHGNDLCVSAACGAALDAEHGTERGLTQSDHAVLTDAAHTVGKTDGSSGFPLTRGCGCNCRYQNKLAVFTIVVFEQCVVYFCLVFAVLFEIFFIHTCDLCDLGNGLHFCALCNFNVA